MILELSQRVVSRAMNLMILILELKADKELARKQTLATLVGHATGAPRPPVEYWRVNPEIAAAAVVEEPLTYEEAVASEQADERRQAMDEEIKSLQANDTWTTEPISKGMRAIPVKWV